MLHYKRHHRIEDVSELSIEEFAALLFETTWCECQGFRHRELVYLNDATSPNGAQEFAVLEGDRQIESLTISWMNLVSLTEILSNLQDQSYRQVLTKHEILAHPDGTCRYCA